MKASLLLALALCLAGTAGAAAQSEQRGLNYVRANCARCHSVDKLTPSPMAIAPPLRDLHKRYPVDTLQEAFAEGIRTGHQNMPEFRLAPDQIGDVIAYLKSLER
jgi:cytochrome c